MWEKRCEIRRLFRIRCPPTKDKSWGKGWLLISVTHKYGQTGVVLHDSHSLTANTQASPGTGSRQSRSLAAR